MPRVLVKDPEGFGGQIHDHKLKAFLQDFGYFKMYPSPGTAFVFVHVADNLVSNNNKLIKDFVMDYIESLGDRPCSTTAGKAPVFKEDYLSMLDTYPSTS